MLTVIVAAAACAGQAEQRPSEETGVSEWLEGFTAQYVTPLKGQSMARDGSFVFLFGPADEDAPMTGEAGSYVISGDTVTNTVLFSSDPDRVGLVYKWTPVATSGDTLTYDVMNEAGEVTGRARSVMVR